MSISNASDISLDTLHMARRVAAVCAAPESHRVLAVLEETESEITPAHLLWLTWVQWRAMGREVMVRETGLSLWTVNDRLRRLREAGAPVFSSMQERELIARGQFHALHPLR
jgi:hypothetical protein